MWPHADTVIYLQYPFWFTFWSLLKRTFYRCWTKQKLWGTCNVERWSINFNPYHEDNILSYMWRTWDKKKYQYEEMLQSVSSKYPDIKIIRMKSRSETCETFFSKSPRLTHPSMPKT